MKVIIFKLDTPGWKNSWLIKDYTIKVLGDIEQIVGFCASHIYAELHHIDEDDDPLLVKEVSLYLSKFYPTTAKSTIVRLFKMLEKSSRVWESNQKV